MSEEGELGQKNEMSKSSVVSVSAVNRLFHKVFHWSKQT